MVLLIYFNPKSAYYLLNSSPKKTAPSNFMERAGQNIVKSNLISKISHNKHIQEYKIDT